MVGAELSGFCYGGTDNNEGHPYGCTRDVRKAGEEEDWKKKTRDRGGWKR